MGHWQQALGILIDEPIISIYLPRTGQARPFRLLGQHVSAIRTQRQSLLLELSGKDALICPNHPEQIWQIEPREPAGKSLAAAARLNIITLRHTATLLHGPEIVLADRASALQAAPDISNLHFERTSAWHSVQSQPDLPISVAIQQQQIAAGIGNIYRSEALFLAGIDPRTPVAQTSQAQWDEFWDIALLEHPQLAQLITAPALSDQHGSQRWVYQRHSQPCRRCQTPVEMVRLGALQQPTYFCPTCQAPPTSLTAAPPISLFTPHYQQRSA